MQMEQVPYFETNIEEIMKENVTSVSSASISVDNNIITDEQPFLKQHSLRCYQPSRLYFDTAVEEEDITQWVHLEPLERVSTSTPERVPTSVPYNNKKKQKMKRIIRYRICTLK